MEVGDRIRIDPDVGCENWLNSRDFYSQVDFDAIHVIKEESYWGWRTEDGHGVCDKCATVVKDQAPDAQETVNHPAHYNSGRIETIDFIEDQQLGFNLGNVIKYISRAGHKGKRRQDLEKAAFYLARELQLIGKEEEA